MTNIYIDCEFNGFGGDLISMALVSVTGQEFYEVLPCLSPVPWVRDNVIPILNKKEISPVLLQQKLTYFLWEFEKVTIIADWPEDIIHFCKTLLAGPGVMITSPHYFEFIIDRRLNSSNSRIPHNALEDARCIKHMHLALGSS